MGQWVTGTYGYDNFNFIVNQAAAELGIGATPTPTPLTETASPFNSTDPNVILLCRLVTSAGRELVDTHDWSFLRAFSSFTTTANESVYQLNSDFRGSRSQTFWNVSNRLPLLGPLTPQQWNWLVSRQQGVILNLGYRLANNYICLYPTTGMQAGIEISYEYRQSLWVSPIPNQINHFRDFPTPDSGAWLLDYVDGSGDYGTDPGTQCCKFDSQLMIKLLKLRFRQAKGFDTTNEERDYQSTLRRVIDGDTESPILDINNNGSATPLLGPQNIPFTGYGS